MNNPFTINVHIDLGITPELMSLLSAFTQSNAFAEKKQEKKVEEAPEKDDPKPKVEKPCEKVEKPSEKADEEEKPKPAEEGKKEYTEQDVREAMHRTRTRIEGEGYKEHTDSDGYKKWHRQLTAWFKNTAATYGADKPSAIDNSDARLAFIKDCDAVETDGDKLIIKVPF